MLVITRKAGEGFFIGDDVEVTILECNGDRAKIGIYAPRNVKIMRSELLETGFRNKEAAVKLPDDILKSLLDSGTDTGKK
ncbi:MAG: carbon storage regulator [Oscillospiraceae bacterium]|jgi:carbon storage regulator|nr:carbon storage regulator [Oscillospiraceae bacterium]